MKITAEARAAIFRALKAHAGWREYRIAKGLDMATILKEQYLAACVDLGIDAAAIVASCGGEAGNGETRDYEGEAHRYYAAKRAAEAATAREQAASTAATASIPAPSGDVAGAALAAMVAPHILASVLPEMHRQIERKLEGVATIRIEVARRDGSTFKTEGMSHPKLATLIRACAARQANGRVAPVWVHGPASSGKTHAAEQVAEALGLTFYTQGACSMAHEVLGFVDAGGRYQATPFRQAFEHGGVVLMDEIDSYDPQATLALNGALANGVCAFPDGMVKRHPDFVCIGAANTTGNGANAAYVGRNRLDAAFLSRFPIKIDWPLDVALEQATSGNVDFALRVQAARARAASAGVKHMIDSRHTAAGAALIAAGFSEDEAAALTYLAGLSPEQVRMVEGR